MDEQLTTILSQSLSEREVRKRLTTFGYNEIPAQNNSGNFKIFFRVISEPMLLLLLACGLLYLFMGEPKDAALLLFGICFIIGITFYQERKTTKTLEALRNLSSPRALVIRDGQETRVPGREVVVGDIVVVEEGDRIPTDAYVLTSSNLMVDESLITGESVPVTKRVWNGTEPFIRPSGADKPFVYSGSLVVSGRGVVKTYAIGIETEIGRIGKSLNLIKEENTLLRKETTRIVRALLIIGGVVCACVVLILVATDGNVIEALLSGLSLSMAMLPEELPVILVVFLTLGAWRMSKYKVLTRHAATIETLGAATVLCADKTGTLTMNKTQLSTLYFHGESIDINTEVKSNLKSIFYPLLEYGILASSNVSVDPIEREIKRVGELLIQGTTHFHDSWRLVKEYPLTKRLLMYSHAWHISKKEYCICTKGAPETIIRVCQLTEKQKKTISQEIERMSDRGLRVLGVAQARYVGTDAPETIDTLPYEFVGLLGFIDPVRPTAKQAIVEAYRAGMRVILITGDYPGTAQYIAEKVGIRNFDTYITGKDIEEMTPQELQEKIRSVTLCVRVMPEQKVSIVNALKANGEIVAMTGDGVNDAPALKSAHIGIAMGERGTDVAREAASLVLLNDDFSSIVIAVRLGRRIYDNIKYAMGYIFAVHIPIAGMSLLPLLFHLPPVLFPAHIAFLELIIDPACSVVFESEKEDRDIMTRPPRNLREPMFQPKRIALLVMQGLSVLTAVFGLYVVMHMTGKAEVESRTMVFVSLVLANILLIVVNLSWKRSLIQIIMTKNRALYVIVIGAIIGVALVVYVPILSSLFHLYRLSGTDIFLIISVVMGSLIWFEIVKALKIFIFSKKKKNSIEII